MISYEDEVYFITHNYDLKMTLTYNLSLSHVEGYD